MFFCVLEVGRDGRERRDSADRRAGKWTDRRGGQAVRIGRRIDGRKWTGENGEAGRKSRQAGGQAGRTGGRGSGRTRTARQGGQAVRGIG